MSEVRFQPKSAPRSTSIARTVVQSQKPSGAGARVSSSPASSPAARTHAQGNQNRNVGAAIAKPSAGAGGITFETDELRVLGQITSSALAQIADHSRQPGLTPEQGAEAAAAYENANKALEKIGAELSRRG